MGAVFLGSRQHTCQIEAVTRRDALLRAPVDVPGATFARIHLQSPEDGVLDLDAVVRRLGEEGQRRGSGFLLAVAFVDPPAHYFKALDRLSAAVATAKRTTASARPALAKTPTPAPPARAKTPTPAPPARAKTPTSSTPPAPTPPPAKPPVSGRDRGNALSDVNTDPSAMLDLYRKALASDKREKKPEESGSLWEKLKRVANKKL